MLTGLWPAPMALVFRQPSIDISANVSILFVSSVVVNGILLFSSSSNYYCYSNLSTTEIYQAALTALANGFQMIQKFVLRSQWPCG